MTSELILQQDPPREEGEEIPFDISDQFCKFQLQSDSDNEIDTLGNTSDQELSDDENLTRAPKLRAMSLESQEDTQDFMLPTAALNTMDNNGNMLDFGNFNSQYTLGDQLGQLQSPPQTQDYESQLLQFPSGIPSQLQFAKSEQLEEKQDEKEQQDYNEQLESYEQLEQNSLDQQQIIISDNQGQAELECSNSGWILGIQTPQENPEGVSNQPGYQPQTILGFLSSQVSTPLT
eukprot:CAMPEP_0196998032 /NCGR_PEP_ID=MMETSP1380-20130617/3524_1 /TAXON_ID=5936 /ORGANISM="Euplotes crassus, Strain CT5" /LENGTH=232 /DNA_ID=CAMNT_0042414471 /DNA_START=180 /DNA_END=879 /DNA_ORIENTATION=-